MTSEKDKAAAEQQVRAAIEAWAQAMRDKEIDAVMALHTPDAVMFDCHSLLQLKGAAALRRHLEICFPCMQGPMRIELHEIEITADGDLAVCHYLMHCGSTGLDGSEHVGWLRVTVGLRRAKGKWLIEHAHDSAPFNPQNGQTMFGMTREQMEQLSAA